MEIQVFIFNYGHFDEALDLFYSFRNIGYDTYLLNCESSRDPDFDETDKIIKLPNVFYSGQWNEALEILTADIAFLINSDVKIIVPERIMNRLKKFYSHYREKAGIYAPNVSYTPWTYNPHLLPNVGSYKAVPGTDSVLWTVPKSIMHKVGKIDLSVNKLGWGIELVAAYYCFLEKKYVVRDYLVKCFHPHHTAYNKNLADRQWKDWVESLGIGRGFWNYYNTIHKYQFGWRGDYVPQHKFKKMNL